MNASSIILYFFLVGAAVSAIAIVFSANVFKAALFFLVCLLNVAAVFVFLFADFVAVTQILIYAGGVLMVLLFGIMFTSRLQGKPLVVKNTNLFSGIIAGGAIFGLIANMLFKFAPPANGEPPVMANNVSSIGSALITDYSIIFEVIGILLLITLVGASVIASFMKIKKYG